MLQQVLRDMYIDPELLAGLKEKEKQTLFCCMREEQIRRWRLWDQKETEAVKNQPPRTKRMGKSVQWALDSTGEPHVDIIDCQYDDTDSVEEPNDNTTKEYEQKELRLSIKDGRCVDLNSSESANKIPKYVEVVSDDKTSAAAAPSVVINFNEKRGALQELSLNKVPKVARQVAEWEKRVNKDESKPTINKAPIKIKDQDNNETDIQQEQLWREQQKKAKEVEIRMRTIARLAREEHRKSLIEHNENFQSFLIQDNAFELCKNINQPPTKEALVEWFRSKEVSKKAVFEKNSSLVAQWFHGFISWREAESILNEEKIGTFLVRISERIWGYAISYKDAIGVKHYLIDASNGHYKILGTDHISHNTLAELISYHKTKPLTSNTDELLKYPCYKLRDLSLLFGKSES